MSIGQKAKIAIASFKWLIAISCVSLLLVSLDLAKTAEMDFTAHGYGVLFLSCTVTVGIAYLLAGGFFMLWFYAAYNTLYLESPGNLRHPPIWTVLGFSLPIANLYLPYVLVVIVWRRLTRKLAVQDDAAQRQAPGYFNIWWLSHLIVLFAIPAGYAFALFNMDDDAMVLMQLSLSLLACALICNLARLAIRFVTEIENLFEAVYCARNY
ncbi:MAG: DUF4328 domain-containing protein [Gammaproteobacteria bacterium]|nr:DUF4328 domain-containing protein [Gammaproteobacteria bacterium]